MCQGVFLYRAKVQRDSNLRLASWSVLDEALEALYDKVYAGSCYKHPDHHLNHGCANDNSPKAEHDLGNPRHLSGVSIGRLGLKTASPQSSHVLHVGLNPSPHPRP